MSVFADKQIVILEMSNNHMGDIDHGIKLIDTFGEICSKYSNIEFVFKLQYRELDTFIHPSYKGKLDIKFIKRFEETRLTRDQFDLLVDVIKKNNFKTMSTPFDNASIPMIVDQKLDYIKVASCSFGDWPLLEDIAKTDLPIIASTAGATLETIDNVVSFFQHRKKDFVLMHCVGEYPTDQEKMNLNQIDFMKKRYFPVEVGLSTHESPNNYELIKMVVAKGVLVFEKHVGLPTKQYDINKYSADPIQFENWLKSMVNAFLICGDGSDRKLTNHNELKTLNDLRRGVVAKSNLKKGDILTDENTYFAFPPEEGQVTANDWSRYVSFVLKQDMEKDGQIYMSQVEVTDSRAEVWDIVGIVKKFVKESGVTIPNGSDLEISHHYGIKNFYKYGISMITVVNRKYCKKIIIVLPGQMHPEQYHKQKEETFHILHGDVSLVLDGEIFNCKIGDVVVVEPSVIHAFSSENGAIIEEISSTHIKDDSFYTDEKISLNQDRKTFVSFWNNQ